MLFRSRSALLKLIQIRVGSGVAQQAAHGDDLTFVVESVCEQVMENERWCPDGDLSIGEMQFRIGV